MLNRVCGCTHRPRDGLIRKLCATAEVTWPEPVRTKSRDLEEEEGEDTEWAFEGEEEEEEEEDDPEQVVEEGHGSEGFVHFCAF